MHYLVVNETSTRAELEEAIVTLGLRKKRSLIPSTAAEVQADIDECLELLLARIEAPT